MKKAQKVLSVLLASVLLSGCTWFVTDEDREAIVNDYAGDYGYVLESDVIDNLDSYFEKYGSDYGYYTYSQWYQKYSKFNVGKSTSSSSNKQSETVYITKTGSKYHKSWCCYLKSSIPISKADAIANGYTACSRCGG